MASGRGGSDFNIYEYAIQLYNLAGFLDLRPLTEEIVDLLCTYNRELAAAIQRKWNAVPVGEILDLGEMFQKAFLECTKLLFDNAEEIDDY